MTSMTLRLGFAGESLRVRGEIVLPEPMRALRFALNRGLKVTGVTCDGESALCQMEGERGLMFRAAAQDYLIAREHPFRRVTLDYAGQVGAWWHCAVAEKLIALNWYSVWFPQELPFAVAKDLVLVEGCENYLLLKGTWDAHSGTWRYGGEGYDPFNLILYRRDSVQIVCGEHLRVYFLDEKQRASAEKSVEVFEDILDFYARELFRTPWTGVVEMACDAPVVRDGGAYKRQGLIVTNRPGDDDGELICINAHELGHEWCSGADVNSWEDWLNETGAEWAMLLYALSRGKQVLYEQQMAWHREMAKKAPPMRPEDGSRPGEGVHNVGTVLMAEVYEAFGAETVAETLRCMVALKEKTTVNLLCAMREAGLAEAAAMLASGLEKAGAGPLPVD